MDVESLAKQLILKGMTDEQQKAILESIKSTMTQARTLQKQRVGENVQVVVQALKKIEADIRDRYDEVGNKIEKRVATIKDGRDGLNGKDGRDGKDGRNGEQGPRGFDGKDGRDGSNGRDGENGVSVTDAHIDFDGSLVISLSSGRQINVGEVVAPDLAEKIKVITNGGGTSQGVLDALDSLQDQINLISAALVYKGTWNASTNTPTLASGAGTANSFYIVSVAGTTTLDGISNWGVGDWATFNGSTWQRIEGGANGNFTDLSVSGTTTLSGLTASTALALDASKNVVSVANTGTGDNVLATSPTLVTPNLGTPASGVATNLTGLPLSTGVTGTLPVVNGGTGQTSYTDGQLLIGNTTGNTLTKATLTAGTGISIANGTGSITVTNSAPDQTVALTGAGGTTVTGTYPNFTISSSSTTYSLASSTVLGLIQLGSDTQQTVAANAVTATASRSYALQVNAAGQGVVNVPWTDTISGGTVTSVGGTGTVSGLTLTGTVTTSGNLTLGGTLAVTPSDFASQTANTILAAPNGTAGTPTFRALVAADVPTLNQNTTGTAANVTGTVAVANGGTGATSLTANNVILGNGTSAVQVVAPGTTGNVLTSNGTTWTSAAPSGGGGGFSDVSVISANTTAVSGTLYVLTASLTLTLPTSPSVGDLVGVSNQSGTVTCVIARSSQNIMGIAEDLTLDINNAGFTLVFSGASKGWSII